MIGAANQVVPKNTKVGHETEKVATHWPKESFDLVSVGSCAMSETNFFF
jgi:hypothetical protein